MTETIASLSLYALGPYTGPLVDPSMTNAEAMAFRDAIASETIPSHLFGFASALAPDHCAAASLLHARGTLLEQRHMMNAATLAQLLQALQKLAFEPETSASLSRSALGPHAATLVAGHRRQLEALAASYRAPPALLYRKARQTAGEMVVDDRATFADVPHAVVASARALIVQLGPVRVVDPARVRLALGPTVHLTSPSEAEDRARWVRHYARAARMRA